VAPSVREGLELIRQAGEILKGKEGLVWRVAENYETEPGYRLASTLLSPIQPSKSPIGTPLSFTLTALTDLRPESEYYQTPWRTHPAYQGGFLLDGGVHSAAVLRTVLPRGARPVRVSGWSGLVREYLKPADWVRVGVELGDDTLGLHRKEDAKNEGKEAPKATGTFHLSFSAPSPTLSTHSDGLVIYGTEGWAEIRTVEVPEATSGLSGKAFRALKEAGRIPLPKADAPSVQDAALKTAEAFVGGGGGEDQSRSTTLTKTKSVIRTTIHTNHPPKNTDGDEWGAGEWAGEEVRVYEEDEGDGVEVELGEFFKAIKGEKTDDIGDPMEALRDVAFIEAALKSEGRVVDLLDLMRGGDGFGGKGDGKGEGVEFELEVFGSL
jgi:predicted dehydrogenase